MDKRRFFISILNDMNNKSVVNEVSTHCLDLFYKEIIKLRLLSSSKIKKIAIVSLNKDLIKKFKKKFLDITFIDAEELFLSKDSVDLAIVSDFLSAFDDERCMKFTKLLSLKADKCIFTLSVKSSKKKPERPRQLLKLTYKLEDYWAVTNAMFTKNFAFVCAKKRTKTVLAFPSEDKHFNRNKDRYQYHVFCMALSSLRHRRLAIDIGGHIGFYAIAMSEVFNQVISFEPYIENYKCLLKNTSNLSNVKAVNVALSNKKETLNAIVDCKNSGNIVLEKGGEIPAKPLDDFGFKNVSLIKIDVQGFELNVLKGASKTIKKNRPIIIIELITREESDFDKEAYKFLLNKLNYKLLFRYGKDFIMGPK